MNGIGRGTQKGQRKVAAAALATLWLTFGGHETSLAQGPEQPHDEKRHEGRDEEHAKEERLVNLTPAELEEFGIEIIPAGSGTIETYVTLPGEVQPNADRLAHIVPRYSGIATEVRAQIGDVVEKGQVLAIIESDESVALYELKTLIPGTVIQKHITLGEACSRENDTYIIADLSTVWVDLTVHQRDLARVHLGQDALIHTRDGPPDASGKIRYVTPLVDRQTRTATARVVLPNHDGKWRPGMFVTARVLVEKTLVPVAVPHTAYHTVDGQTVVFVQTERGFRPQAVTLGRLGETSVEVVSGLAPGDRYASRGGFTLKAELEKAAFDEGHAH